MSASLVAPAVGPRAAALAAVTSRTRIAWFLRGGASGVDLYQPGCGDRSHFSFDRRASRLLDRSRAARRSPGDLATRRASLDGGEQRIRQVFSFFSDHHLNFSIAIVPFTCFACAITWSLCSLLCPVFCRDG